MQIRTEKWTALCLICAVVLLSVCAALTFLVDPFEHYRESSILPLYDQESYNNPGIARNYDYNAVILGTSMVEMSMPSVIDDCFSVSSVKLPMRGSHTAQMGWQLGHVLQTHPLSLAILAVDAYSLMGPPDDDEEIITYLWDDRLLNDVYYLLNRDVLFVRIPRMLKNRGLPLDGKRDSMYQWTDVVFSEASVISAVEFSSQKEMQPVDSRLERSTENISRHLESYISAYPETRFVIYFPPYSVGYWYMMTRGGLSEQQYRSRQRVCELLLSYPNVEIYDYSSRTEWTENLSQYFDYSHHNTAVSNAVMRAIAAGENRILTLQDIERNNEGIRQSVERFIEKYEPK
ncbi:MAG: hypothetical protein IJ242_14220 [Clostridia bacterium]|nr:hypothetical protein [Clostridia bacterium]